MNLERLKRELAALDVDSQRHIAAFLVSLRDARDPAYRQKMAEKIDLPASKFGTLEELDRRLGLSGTGDDR